MKKNDIYIISFLSFVFFGCSSKMTFIKVSENIYRDYGGKNDKSTFKLNYYERDARNKAYLADSNSFLKGKIDQTLYFVEVFDYESGYIYGRIWDKSNHIDYLYSKETCRLQKTQGISDRLIYLVTKWDTTSVICEERKSNNMTDNNLFINVIRCKPFGRHWEIMKINLDHLF